MVKKMSQELNQGQGEKEPWLAVNLSLFFPGIGQFYAQKFTKAFLWAIGQLGVLIFSMWSIFSPQGNVRSGLIALVIAVLIYLFNILDAHLSVHQDLKDTSLEKIPRRHKNPWFAVFVSRIMPGLGHLYGNQSVLGLIFLTISLILLSLANYFPPLWVFPPLIAAFVTYHIYLTFPHQYHPHKHTHRNTLSIMVGVIFAWGVICNYFPRWLDYQLGVFSIPSESMLPTLHVGDRIFVKKSANHSLKRGAIVVFHPSQTARKMIPDGGEYFVKRIIGQPQETVEIKDGRVYINNQHISESYITEPPQYQWGPAIVPNDSYVVLGDNRNNSFDSHEWGFLPQENLVGQAYKVFWPLERVKSLL